MYEQYTDKQIIETLVPKLKKAVPDGYNWDECVKHPEFNRKFIKAAATVYRLAYIRGQLGRSFIVNEREYESMNFNVGDYVETKNNARGYIDNVDGMTWKCTQSSKDYMYLAGHTYHIPVEEKESCFIRIGQYDFTKRSEDKIELLCEEYTKSFPVSKTTVTANSSNDWCIDLGIMSKKINELVEAVNWLKEKVKT